MITFRSANFRYALIYMLVTTVVLVFLNVFCSLSSQDMFHRSNKASITEKCKLAAAEIAELDVLTDATVSKAMTNFEDLNEDRLIVTDHTGKAVYDTNTENNYLGKMILIPEVISALSGNDVFVGNYYNGIMHSSAAVPVYAYGTLVGCVHITESNASQGALIADLRKNVFTITLILEIIVVLSAVIFSVVYARRLRKIMYSIRDVQEGDYSHKIQLSGNDELNALGNDFNNLVGKLQKSEQKRNQFVSDASHELKTPLASIKLLADSILQNELDDATIKEFIGDIGNEADRLNRMSQKLLTLSKADTIIEESNNVTYIAPTIERIVRMLSGLAAEKNVNVITNIQNDSTILINEDALYQILFNLIENGIKYNRTGGRLEITLVNTDTDAILTIRDTGVGIPQDSLDHIFERFYRVDKARSRSTGGSGLGLSIVRSMIRNNNGTITVESEIDVGTAFTITFPIFNIREDAT